MHANRHKSAHQILILHHLYSVTSKLQISFCFGVFQDSGCVQPYNYKIGVISMVYPGITVCVIIQLLQIHCP